MSKINIFWFRRDLRLEDNCGLHEALQSDVKVLSIFIFDREILDQLNDKKDKRVDYIHQALEKINQELKEHETVIKTFYGKPLEIFEKLAQEFEIDTVFCNRDYEPQAIKRDQEIADFLAKKDIKFSHHKDQVIFEGNDILKSDQTPYTVFTPYSKKMERTYQYN